MATQTGWRASETATTSSLVYGGPPQSVAARRACNQSVFGHEEFPSTHNCVIPYTLLDHTWTPYHPTVQGFVHPLVVTATMVTNCLVCAVLLRPSMRSPTSTLLVAMAFSDTLTGLLPTPCYVVFYGLGLYADWVPFNWCLPYIYFTDHLPTVFHTASVWLTVALAAQRYVHVCHAGVGKRVCTVPNMLRVIAIVYALSLLVHLPRLLETRVDNVRVESLVEPGVEVDACYVHYAALVERYMNLYFGTYFWLRVVIAHLVPCTVLVVLNAALANTMSVARRRRSQLLTRRGGGAHDRECRRLGDSIATTLMLVAVVGVLLLVELPLAVFLILVIVENTWHRALMADGVASTAALFINLVIVLSYPVNFFIYCGMSRQFRTTFAAMFSCGGAQTSAGGLVTTPGATYQRAAAVEALPSSGVAAGDRPLPDAVESTPPLPASSSLLGRLRRSAVGAVVSSPRVNIKLHSVSLLGNASPTDEGQLDSGHI